MMCLGVRGEATGSTSSSIAAEVSSVSSILEGMCVASSGFRGFGAHGLGLSYKVRQEPK